MIHYITTNGIQNPWVANELKKLKEAGIPFRLHAIRKPRDLFHDAAWARSLHEETVSIYPLSPLLFLWSSITAPLRYRADFFHAFWQALIAPRESFKIRLKMILHLFVAAYWLQKHGQENLKHLHAQWVHSSGSIAMYAAWLSGVSWSFTGHAADLFRERCGLVEKVKRADFISCISTFHRDLYLEHGADPEKLIIVYCGIDVDLFERVPRQFDWKNRPIRLLSTGRLVEKKGFDTLIEACAILRDRDVAFTCTIGGSGPLEQTLRAQIKSHQLDNLITLTGASMKQETIPGIMAEHDLFILACKWAKDNDVDGLPQMLMEAMACGMPAISTRLVGTPDLVIHDQTGLLAESENPEQLADMIQRLVEDPAEAERLADAGCEHARTTFNLATCVEPLLKRFRSIEYGDQ